MIRLLDILLSALGILILFVPGLVITVIGYFDTGSPIFVQKRMGKDKRMFSLYKFRTMRVGTKSVPTHLITSSAITAFGSFLRKSKLDEIPQLFNVLIGDMSLVGPRPNLIEQTELIELREKHKVYDYKPGITGLSQINQIDMSNPKMLAESDGKMLEEFSFQRYFQYLVMTLTGHGFGDKVRN